jgi:hypothetical protein
MPSERPRSWARIDAIADGFHEAYGSMLNEGTRNAALPSAVCTIYDPRYAAWRKLATAALTLLNDKIMRHAVARRLTLIDLRLTCDEERDFANPIEPSANRGAKIAEAISKFVGAEPRSHCYFHRQVAQI